MNQTNEIYPMPSFVRLVSVDIDESRKWYFRLGFIEIYAMNAPDGSAIMSHLRWAKYADLMLVKQRSTNETPPGSSVTLYFTTDHGTVDQIADRVRETIVEGPLTQPWNTREVIFSDPSGLRIAFAEQAETNRSFEDVMSDVKKNFA